MVQPTKTISKKANDGFCSFKIKAKNVAINPNPAICKISMAASLPLSLEQKNRFYFLEQVIHNGSNHKQYVDKSQQCNPM